MIVVVLLFVIIFCYCIDRYFVFVQNMGSKYTYLYRKLAAAQKWGLISANDPMMVYLEDLSDQFDWIKITMYQWFVYLIQRYIQKKKYIVLHSIQVWNELAEEILLPIQEKLEECERMHNPEGL